jgi:hypothetical protein
MVYVDMLVMKSKSDKNKTQAYRMRFSRHADGVTLSDRHGKT